MGLPRLPMANCAHYRYEGNRYGCALGGDCEPANSGQQFDQCRRGYVRVRRVDARRISTTKPKLSIDELAAKNQRCREAKAQGKPCVEFVGSNQPAPPVDATFVWVYWHGGAKADELRWSMRSVLSNYHGNASIVVVGDPPAWYTGPQIRMERSGPAYMRRYRDQLNKFHAACKSDLIPESFVWMMDDTYFMKRVTHADLSRHFFHGAIPAVVKGGGEWRHHKRETFAELRKHGKLLVDYCTHMPHILHKAKFLETWERYQLGTRTLQWELLYGADHWTQRERIDPRVFGRINDKQTPSSAIWNNSEGGWSASLHETLQKRFPNRPPLIEGPFVKTMRGKDRMAKGLQDLIAHLPPGPLVMAEIGSYAGESAAIFATSGKFSEILCVDSWASVVGSGIATADAESHFDEVAKRFPIIRKRKAKSVDAARHVPDQSLDVVYIDGKHDYQSVRADLKAWAPKVKPGGWMCGHDYSERTPGVMRAVRKAFKKPFTVFADDSWAVCQGG